MGLRDRIRAKTVGASNAPRGKVVEVDGERVEILDCTWIERTELIGRHRKAGKSVDATALAIEYMTTGYCRVPADAKTEDGSPDPDAGKPIWDEKDREGLRAARQGSWAEKVAGAVIDVIFPDLERSPGKGETPTKPSETPSST